MGTVLGLGVGVGLLLVWLALASPPREQGDSSGRPGRVRELLDRAGLSGTSVGGVWTVCLVSAVVVFVAGL